MSTLGNPEGISHKACVAAHCAWPPATDYRNYRELREAYKELRGAKVMAEGEDAIWLEYLCESAFELSQCAIFATPQEYAERHGVQ